MSISKLFWWIYQLPVGDLIRILLMCTILFLGLHRQLGGRPWWRGALAALLLLWACAALWPTILNREGGTENTLFLIPFHSYREFQATDNWEILRSSFMNVALFYPAGLLFAAILPERWRAPATVVILCIFSLSIEVVQYCCLLGRAEIDDVLHNTLGAVIGCLAFSMKNM